MRVSGEKQELETRAGGSQPASWGSHRDPHLPGRVYLQSSWRRIMEPRGLSYFRESFWFQNHHGLVRKEMHPVKEPDCWQSLSLSGCYPKEMQLYPWCCGKTIWAFGFHRVCLLGVGVDKWKESATCSPEAMAVSWAVKVYVTLLRHNIHNQKMQIWSD